MESHGEIDRRPATWRYERTEGDKVGRLSWAEEHVPSPDSQWPRIQTDCIIAIVQVDFRKSNEYRLLYVSESETAAEKSASPVLFKTITISNPPDRLVQDFQPADSASFYSRLIREGLSPNIHVIVSTGSGTGKAADVWERLLKPFLDHICKDPADKSYQLHFTESETSIADLSRTIFLPRANEGIAQSIILLSGDGGLVDIANTLVSEPRSPTYKKPDVAILPLGTGNAMAHSSGITKDKTLGLSTLIRGSPKEVPLFRASFSPGSRLLINEAREERELPTCDAKATCHGAVVCSWGLHAGLVADSDTAHYRQFGAERFQMAAKEALYPSDGSLPHPYRGKLSILRPGASEWERVDRDEHAYVLATLCSHLEASFHISPASRQLDGKLRLVHFGPMSGDEVMQLMTAAYQDGKHVQDARVGYEEIEGLKIEFYETDARWRRVCVDGKIIRVEQGGWVEVKVGGGEGLVDLIAM